jgi:hypothetical protein
VYRRTTDLRIYLTRDIEGVRDFMLKATRPSWTAWTAVILLVAGLVLQTAANVAQVMTGD